MVRHMLEILIISFSISYYSFPFRNPHLSFWLFSASAILSNAALIWLFDYDFGIVYFAGNSSIVSETLITPIFVTLTSQPQKWVLFQVTM